MTNYQFWRHNNHPKELWSNQVIKQKIDYDLQNPVKVVSSIKQKLMFIAAQEITQEKKDIRLYSGI